jgi:HlyD family secretion protein
VSRGEVALVSDDPQGQDRQGRGGRGRGPQVEVTDQDCAAVTAAFAKHPDAEKQLSALRERMQKGELDMQQMRDESQKIYAAVGVDQRVAGACRMRDRNRAGGAPGAASRGDAAQGRGSQGVANPELSTPVQAGEFPNRARPRTGLVFVAENNTYTPRVIRLGVGNFDYTEVLSGVKEGDRVALLAAAAMQARRDEQNNRQRNMMGGGVPGMQRGGNVPAGPGGPGRGGR